MTSSDGITWKTRSTSGIDKSYRSIVYANGVFVSVAGSNSGSDVMTSGKADYSVLATNNIYQGGTSFFGGLRAGTTSASIASIFLQSQAGINPFAIASSTGSSLLTVNQAGNLGIGTTTPNSLLTVQGVAGSATSLLTVASSTGNSIFNILPNGRVGVGTSTPAAQLAVQGESINLNLSPAPLALLVKGGNGSIGGGIDLIGGYGDSSGGSINIAGGPGTAAALGGNVNISAGNGGFGANGGNVLLTAGNGGGFGGVDGKILLSGNVGISTTTGSAKLTVAGDTYIGGSLSVLGALKDSSNASGTAGYVLQTTGSGTQWVATSSLGFGSSLSGGAVGFATRWLSATTLGTSTLLDNGLVAGINATSSSYSFNVQGASGINPFRVASSTGTALLAILNNGNVGIGTETPGERLEIVGNIISKGTEWTLRNSTTTNQWSSVTYGNGLFVAVSYTSGNQVMTSPDGITWTSRISAADNFWNSVTYGNGLFVAVSSNGSGNRVMTSPDGIIWTSRTSAANNSWSSVTYGNGLFVAVSNDGSGNRVMTSSNGITWTSRSSAIDNYWQSVTYGNGLFVAVGSEDTDGVTVMTSPDGITWTSRTPAEDNNWSSVTYGNGLFVAVGSLNYGSDSVMTSPDGITWTSRTAAANTSWQSVVYGNGLFVAVSGDGTNRVMTSPDGITWTSRSVTYDKYWTSVTYGNGTFVAVGSDGSGQDVMTSGKADYSVLATNNIYQGGMSVFGNFRIGSSTDSNPFSIASTTGSNLFSITNSGRAIFGTTTSANIFLNGGSATTPVANSNSIAIGNEALTFISTTSATLRNIALGYQALYGSSTALMTGTDNFAVGYQSGYSNTTGSGNSFIGYQSGVYNTTGSDNYFTGASSGFSNTTGSKNLFIGRLAGFGNTTGSDNVAMGSSALFLNLTGNANIALGTSTLYNTTGSNNIGLGAFAGLINTSGNNNTFLGAYTNATANNFSSSTAIGAGSIVGRSNALILGGTGNSYVNVGIGTTTPASTLTIRGTAGNNLLNIASSTGASLLTLFQDGNLALGTTTSNGLINMERLSFTGNGTVAGINQYLTFANGTASVAQYANQTFISTANTATTTLVGNIIRLADSTTFGNTVRGFEVQTERGNNTQGENTAISGFARTFGVRGVTEGDAGASFEPAGVYGETRGTTQGNAIRGYSSTITTSSLLKLFQDTSTFTGTGLLMNFGNSGGSFSSTTASRYVDFKNAGTSIFTVGAYGMLTIGNGTTNNAGLQIGYGGICVDNDGSCNASTTGRITSVSSATGNSDLAEMYFSNEDLIPGEIVYLKEGLSVGRASTSTKSKVLGVVSTLPGLLMGQDDVSLNSGEEGHPIALAGRVPVRLSNENGDIKAGDELMLSSIPGVAMKASSTGMVVGRALEDFNPDRAYSDTYINQFGESIIVPEYTPIDRLSDPRIDDGCYYGGGNASGEEPCVPLVGTTTEARYDEADALALQAAKDRALRALTRERSTEMNINEEETVKVGQIVMFVDLHYRYLDEAGEAMLATLLGNASTTDANSDVTETVWERLVNLANNFIDGVLRVLTLKADRVETSQLCVDGVCVNANDLRQILNQNQSANQPPENNEDNNTDDIPTNDEEQLEEEVDETASSTVDGVADMGGTSTSTDDGTEEDVEEGSDENVETEPESEQEIELTSPPETEEATSDPEPVVSPIESSPTTSAFST